MGMLAALCEVLIGTTGFVVLNVFGRRHREPNDTACMLVGLGVWVAVGGLVWLAYGASWGPMSAVRT
jgi:hypothetical protein